MTEKELWNYFLARKVYTSKPVLRTQVWVAYEDFLPVKHHFAKEFNIFHPDRSFRSSGYFLHIQCIEQGEYVLVHRDMVNHARFFPFVILHFLFDVLPFMMFAWYKRVSFLSLFTPPQR